MGSIKWEQVAQNIVEIIQSATPNFKSLLPDRKHHHILSAVNWRYCLSSFPHLILDIAFMKTIENPFLKKTNNW